MIESREAASAAPFGIDRHAGGAELIDVAINGADGNFEFLRQRLGAEGPTHLQKDQERKKPARTHSAIIA